MNHLSFLSLASTIIFSLSLITTPITGQFSLSHKIEDNHTHKISVKNSRTSFEVEYEGEIIIGISDGGYFELKKKSFGSKRRILIDSDQRGQLTKKYYVGRRESSYEPDGRKWLAEVLPEVVRSTTIGAESRVQRFYNQGGVTRVLGEIRNMEEDYSASHYFGILLDYDISDDDLTLVINTAGRTLDSDHYLSTLLRDHRDSFLKNDATISAYINAAGSLGSDHYMSEVLRDAIDDADISQPQMQKLIVMTADIDSDHYISEVLRSLLSNRNPDDGNIKEILKLSNSIGSDHYKTELIKEVMRSRRDLDDSMLDIVLESLSDVNSDHYASEIIKDLYSQRLSDHMVAKVLSYTADNINSDHYATESLNTVISRYDLGESAFDAVLDALDDINSDHYTNEVVKKISKQDNITEEQLVKLIEVLAEINSDHYLADALVHLSDRVSQCGDSVSDAYHKAARQINSETYYGRALKAINRR